MGSTQSTWAPEHLAFYYERYFSKKLDPKSFSCETVEDILDLVNDTIAMKPRPRVLQSLVDEDVEGNGIFMKLTEFNRRLRMKRVGAGTEAPLCFPGRPANTQPPPGSSSLATWHSSAGMTGMAAAGPSQTGKAGAVRPATSKAAGGMPGQGVAGPGMPWAGFAQNLAQMQSKMQTQQARPPMWAAGMQSPVWGSGLNANPGAAAMTSFLGGAARMNSWFNK